jgi:hypothetical protein
MAEHTTDPQPTTGQDEATRDEIRAKLLLRSAEKPDRSKRKRTLTEPEKAGISMTVANSSQSL